MKPDPNSAPQPDDLTPFERFDRLFRQVIAVPKEAIVKAQAKIDKQKKRKRKTA